MPGAVTKLYANPMRQEAAGGQQAGHDVSWRQGGQLLQGTALTAPSGFPVVPSESRVLSPQVSQRGSNLTTEIRAGITTFLTAAYIMAVARH